MKYNDELKIGDLVTVINTHKDRKTDECVFVVINIIEDNVSWRKTPITLVRCMLVEGAYIDWNGYYGQQKEVYEPKDKIVYKFKKPALKLVRRFEG